MFKVINQNDIFTIHYENLVQKPMKEMKKNTKFFKKKN